MRTMGEVPRLNARRYPNRKALVMGDEWLTYSEFNAAVNRVAHGLLSLGVAPGDRVALLGENSLQYPVAAYAALKCGALVVPLNFRFQAKELAYAVNNSEASVLLFGPEMAQLVGQAREYFEEPVLLLSLGEASPGLGPGLDALAGGRPDSEPSVTVEAESPAMIMYTSGTTGVPKGVVHSHRSYLNIALAIIVEGDVTHDERTLINLPLFHSGGLNALLLPTLMMGGTSIITSKGFEPDRVLGAVEAHGVTLTMWVPTMLAMLVNHPGAERYDCSSLEKIWYGSSAISPTVLEASRRLFKSSFYQWFGQTETGMNAVLRPEDHADRAHCTGREAFNSEVRVVDAEGRDVAEGEVGELICARDVIGMIGYWKQEEATRNTIRDGWIHTGDLVRVEGEGFFTVVDRLKDMIISGAENIYAKEIEDLIVTHRNVLEVAVIGIPDDVYGEAVCAVVVPRPGCSLTETEVIDFCAERISRYKRPKKVLFLEALPKNATGKVTKNPLREPFWAGRSRRV